VVVVQPTVRAAKVAMNPALEMESRVVIFIVSLRAVRNATLRQTAGDFCLTRAEFMPSRHQASLVGNTHGVVPPRWQ
jgi:hypothetical protein